MWTNEREKLSFQFAKYGLVNTNIFDVASSNGRTYLFLKTTSFISKRERSKNFRSSVLSSVLRLQCFLFRELRSVPRMRTIISVFTFHFCSVRVLRLRFEQDVHN